MTIRSGGIGRRAAAVLAAVLMNGVAATSVHAQYDICAQSAASLRQSRAEDIQQEVQRAQAEINAVQARATAARMEQEAQARRTYRAEMAEIAARRAARAREGLPGRAVNALNPFEGGAPARKLRAELGTIRAHWRTATAKERAEIRADSERRLSTIRLAYKGSLENRQKANCANRR